jgi:putative transposase
MANALSGYYCAIPCQVTDETYIKVRGKWVYLYRAVDRGGQTLDLISLKRGNFQTGSWHKRYPRSYCHRQKWSQFGWPEKLNVILKYTGGGRIIEIVQSIYLNHCMAG